MKEPSLSSPSRTQPSLAEQAAPLLTRQHDPILLAVVLALCGFGIVMVYSASAMYAQRKFGSATYFLNRALLWNLIGMVGMAITARIDYAYYRRLVYPLLGLSIFLLGAVLVVGVRINGAKRWFHLLGVSFQPAEMAKLALVLYLAHSLAKKAGKIREFTVGFLPHLLVCGIIMLLLLKQPDLGTAVIVGIVTLTLLFIAGANILYILLALLAAAPIIYQAIVGTSWRMKRIMAFLDPWQFRYDVGYQITESLISIGSGGIFGHGLGDSKQKLFFLPESHTDYIMAIVGEELGFFGIATVTLAMVTLLYCGCRAAIRARDSLGCYIAFGITTMLAVQAVINLGVVLGSLPTKGLPLPFVSFGGSTLVIDLVAIGILLNISKGGPMEKLRLPRPLQAVFRSAVSRVQHNRRRPGGGKRVRITTKASSAPLQDMDMAETLPDPPKDPS